MYRQRHRGVDATGRTTHHRPQVHAIPLPHPSKKFGGHAALKGAFRVLRHAHHAVIGPTNSLQSVEVARHHVKHVRPRQSRCGFEQNLPYQLLISSLSLSFVDVAVTGCAERAMKGCKGIMGREGYQLKSSENACVRPRRRSFPSKRIGWRSPWTHFCLRLTNRKGCHGFRMVGEKGAPNGRPSIGAAM